MDKPLLLIDVDGVISLFGFDPHRPPPGRFEFVDGIAHFLSSTAGGHLRRLSRAFELVWCTGWEDKANEYLPRALDLPAALPHLTFEREVRLVPAHWKLGAIERFAGPERPLAWIDDAFDDTCGEWAARRPAPTLLVSTDPPVGLTDAHVDELLTWAQSYSNAPCRPAPARNRSRPN